MFLIRTWSLIVCLLSLALASAAQADTQTVTNLPRANLADSSNIKRTIVAYFPDAPIMVEVARCESGLRHRTESGALLQNTKGGSASGTFQVLMRIHRSEMLKMGLDPNNDADYMTYVKYLFDTFGLKPWRPSRHCWGDHLA